MIENNFFIKLRYPQRYDLVTCYSCGVSIFAWEVDDDILREHERYSWNCKIVLDSLRSKKNFYDDESTLPTPPPPSPDTTTTIRRRNFHYEPIGHDEPDLVAKAEKKSLFSSCLSFFCCKEQETPENKE